MSTGLQGMAQDVSTTVTDKTVSMVTAFRNTSIAQNYIIPVLRRARQTYDRSHWTVKVFLASGVAMSAVPVICFLSFMSVVTVGCLIVAAIAFTIVEVKKKKKKDSMPLAGEVPVCSVYHQRFLLTVDQPSLSFHMPSKKPTHRVGSRSLAPSS